MSGVSRSYTSSHRWYSYILIQQLDIEGPEGDANLGPNAVNVALLQALQEQSKVLRGVQDVLKEMQADQGGSGTSNDKIAEQMNNVGLISAFMCSIIFSVFIACDSDELNAADLRWDALEPTKWVIGGNAQLSEHLAYTSALGVGFNTLGMLLAVTVLLLEGSSHEDTSIYEWVAPLMAAAYISLVVGFELSIVSVYFVAWVKYPESVTEGPGFFLLGCWVIMGSAIMWVYAIVIHARMNKLGKWSLIVHWFSGGFLVLFVLVMCISATGPAYGVYYDDLKRCGKMACSNNETAIE